MYYVVRLEWSLTERETRIVKANSEQAAKAYFTYDHGPRYVSVTGSSEQIVDLIGKTAEDAAFALRARRLLDKVHDLIVKGDSAFESEGDADFWLETLFMIQAKL